MSFRPRYTIGNTFPPVHNNNIEPVRNSGTTYRSNVNVFQPNEQNNFRNCGYNNRNSLFNNPPELVPHCFKTNKIGNTYASVPQSINPVPPSCPNLVNTRPSAMMNSSAQPANINTQCNQYQIVEEFHNRNLVVPFNPNSSNLCINTDQRNTPNQHFSYPEQNPPYNNLPHINYHGNQNLNLNISANNMIKTSPIPQTLPFHESMKNHITPSVNYSVVGPGNMSTPLPQPVISPNLLTMPPMLLNSPQVPSSTFQNENVSNSLTYDIEVKLAAFLSKFSVSKQVKKNKITVPEYRYAIKAVIHLIRLLKEKKKKLTSILEADEREWRLEMQSSLDIQKELSSFCSFISSPDHLNSMMKKIKLIKKKRNGKKLAKQYKLAEKVKAEHDSKERDQEIDKWLDDIKEKNQKLKREAEMKKEADFILLEVRRKIHEAKKTIEKIKAFEKLRHSRQENSLKKGLHIQSEHNEKFKKKMSVLKETMQRQLVDYEAEEKALKVMLETEQEGQWEEEAQWKIKKLKTMQQKKQKNIIECLFGVSGDPLPTDPLYLFHKYHTSANSSIENLVQIRRQWDSFLSEDGESVPQQWVVPVAPSNASWEQSLTSKNHT